MRKTRRLGGRGQRGCSGATHPAPHRCAPAGASHWAAARRACTSGRQNMAGGGRDRACTAARVHACAPAVAGLGACGASSAAGAHGGRRARTNGATRAPRVLEGEGACAPERRRRDARVRGAHAPPVSGGSMCLGSSGGYHRAGLPRRHNGACGGRWRSVLRARVRCGLRSVRRGRGSRGQTASSLGSGPHTRGVHSGGGARAASVSLPQMRGWGRADRSDGWLELSGGWAYLFFFRVLAHEPRSFSPRRRAQILGLTKLPPQCRDGRTMRRDRARARWRSQRAVPVRAAALWRRPSALAGGLGPCAGEAAGAGFLRPRDAHFLAYVAAKCPRVAAIDFEGCGEAAQLWALAVRASALCDSCSG